MWGLHRFRNFAKQARERRALRQAERAVARFPMNRLRRPHGLAQPLIVSLTSYPARYPTLAKTLKSLLDQTVVPDRTILWISHGDMAALPDEVRAFDGNGLEIKACDDMRSYKKLIPALRLFPDASIVTADDDVYYRPDWLARMVAAAKAEPGTVVAHRCHLASQDAGGAFRSYADWQMATDEPTDTADGLLFPTGVGGVLYPPGSLDPRVLDVATFQALCPHGDDIWLFWMTRLAGTPLHCLGTIEAPIAWDGSQDVALLHRNWLSGGNDEQVQAMERHFGRLARADVDRPTPHLLATEG